MTTEASAANAGGSIKQNSLAWVLHSLDGLWKDVVVVKDGKKDCKSGQAEQKPNVCQLQLWSTAGQQSHSVFI